MVIFLISRDAQLRVHRDASAAVNGIHDSGKFDFIFNTAHPAHVNFINIFHETANKIKSFYSDQRVGLGSKKY